jgi:hypothetical protein
MPNGRSQLDDETTYDDEEIQDYHYPNTGNGNYPRGRYRDGGGHSGEISGAKQANCSEENGPNNNTGKKEIGSHPNTNE